MPGIPFGLSSYERGEGDLPELPVINMYAEETPTEENRVILQSRPGLEDRAADMGSGPVDCLFKRDLVLGGALYGVSGGTLYEGTTALGAVMGTGPWSIAGYETSIFVAGGTGLYLYDGSGLSTVSFPDDASVLKVVIGASRVICIRADTGKFYWSDSLETNIDALDFATAENQPDRLLDMLFIDDKLILFGAETVEFWPNTPDALLPFQPLEGAVIEKGVKATGCAAGFGSTFVWVTSDNQVCLGDENTIISNPGLEAKIARSANCRVFTTIIGGMDFAALRIDRETHVYNRRMGTWSEFTSYGEANFIPQCFAGGVFGSAIDGRTLTWGDGHEDAGGTLERRFRAGFLGAAGFVVRNLILRCNVGQTPYLAGDYVEPQVEMRISLDNGQTWGAWRGKSLGAQGDYGVSVVWRALGTLRRWKGFLAEFRVTAPVDWRVSAVTVNDKYGGR